MRRISAIVVALALSVSIPFATVAPASADQNSSDQQDNRGQPDQGVNPLVIGVGAVAIAGLLVALLASNHENNHKQVSP